MENLLQQDYPFLRILQQDWIPKKSIWRDCF